MSNGPYSKERQLVLFWSKVKKTATCWLWQGGTTKSHKYGQHRFQGRHMATHRLSWELAYGPIPEGQEVLHSCDTPACVRPSHLFLGTQSDNNKDCCQKKRHVTSCGEHNGQTKLSLLQVLEIRRRLQEGETQRSLAQYFGVSKTTVADIGTHKNWRTF